MDHQRIGYGNVSKYTHLPFFENFNRWTIVTGSWDYKIVVLTYIEKQYREKSQ